MSCHHYYYWYSCWLNHGAGKEQRFWYSLRQGIIPSPRAIWESSFLFFFPSLYDIFNSLAKIPETVCFSFPHCIPKQEVACLLAGVGCLTERHTQKAVMTQFARMLSPLCAGEGGSLVRSSLWRVPKVEQRHQSVLASGECWHWENWCHVNYLKDHLVQRWGFSW